MAKLEKIINEYKKVFKEKIANEDINVMIFKRAKIDKKTYSDVGLVLYNDTLYLIYKKFFGGSKIKILKSINIQFEKYSLGIDNVKLYFVEEETIDEKILYKLGIYNKNALKSANFVVKTFSYSFDLLKKVKTPLTIGSIFGGGGFLFADDAIYLEDKVEDAIFDYILDKISPF